MALFALWLAAIVAIAAITIEVSRLSDTATEVQVAVDAAALAGAENLLKGGNVDSAKAAARTVAAQNRTDGRARARGTCASSSGATPSMRDRCRSRTCRRADSRARAFRRDRTGDERAATPARPCRIAPRARPQARASALPASDGSVSAYALAVRSERASRMPPPACCCRRHRTGRSIVGRRRGNH